MTQQSTKHVLIRAMNRVMPTCEDVTHLVSIAMDEKLSLYDRMKVRMHLWFCAWCSQFERQLMFIRRLTRELQSESASGDSSVIKKLNPEAKAKLRDLLGRELS